jgi:hypothetical protein
VLPPIHSSFKKHILRLSREVGDALCPRGTEAAARVLPQVDPGGYGWGENMSAAPAPADIRSFDSNAFKLEELHHVLVVDLLSLGIGQLQAKLVNDLGAHFDPFSPAALADMG